MKPYPKYKDASTSLSAGSGVEWIGDVPETWSVLMIKRLGQVSRGASPRPIDDEIYFDEEGEYAWVRISDVTASNGFLDSTTQRLSALGASKSVKLEPNRLFISIAATIGKPCITKIKACIHDGFVYFKNFSQDQMYLFYIFLGGEAFKGLGKWGTQLNLNTDIIGGIKIPLPPLDEQRAIAAYLDRETAKIDTLIAKQEQLIALIDEKRQALISHAVTKGVDSLRCHGFKPVATRSQAMKPYPKYKDASTSLSAGSGVEWLGEVPAHWEVIPLKYVARIRCGFAFDSQKFLPTGIPVIRIGNIDQAGKINLENIKCIENTLAINYTAYFVVKDDILMAMTGGTIGKIGIYNLDEPSLLNQRVCKFINKSHIQNKILYYNLIAHFYQEQILLYAVGGAQPNISDDQLANIIIPLPPLDEQRAIAAYLDRETAKLDTLKAKAQSAIDLLKEKRSALISAAVTGKIDVRDSPSDSLPSDS